MAYHTRLKLGRRSQAADRAAARAAAAADYRAHREHEELTAALDGEKARIRALLAEMPGGEDAREALNAEYHRVWDAAADRYPEGCTVLPVLAGMRAALELYRQVDAAYLIGAAYLVSAVYLVNAAGDEAKKGAA